MRTEDETKPLDAALGELAAAPARRVESLSDDRRDRALAPGTVIGNRFEVMHRLGAGGMGVVYAAYDPTLDRRVAVKLVRDASAVSGGAARTLREARSLATVSHANVIVVYDVGVHDDGVFLAMEFLDGGTLREWLRAPKRATAEIVEKFVQAARGLAGAHDAGLVHRDFKPDNVLLGKDGRVRVADFGLARRRADDTDPTTGAASGLDPSSQLTHAGAIVGTPSYMSPEQVKGAELDARSDQFSFCVALFEALTGEHPFGGAMSAAGPRRAADPGPKVPARVAAVLTRGLSVDPADRFPSMHALVTALGAERRHGRWPVAIGVAGFGVAAVAAVLLMTRGSSTRASPCGGGAARLDAVWNAARSQKLRQAFAATGAPHAGAAWKAVAAAFDRYGKGWTAAHRETCEATRVRGEQSEALLDVRMACLDARLADLDALATVLASADRALVSDAAAAAGKLPGLGPCAEAAARRWLPELPDEPTARARAVELQKRLAAARAFLVAGRYPAGMALVPALRADAVALGYRPLEAEVLLVAGRLESGAGRLPESKATLRAGLRAATAGQHDRVATEIALQLMTAAMELTEHEAAADWGGDAEAGIERLGGDVELAATLAAQRGYLAMRENRFDEALALFDGALDLDRQAGARDPFVRATILRRMSLVRQLEGDMDGAHRYGGEALALVEHAAGPWHPSALAIRSNLAVGNGDAGNWAESLAGHDGVRALREQVLGAEHLDIADNWYGIARAQMKLGRLAEARTSAERALAIRVAALPPGHVVIGECEGQLGRIAMADGKPAEAREHFERALVIFTKELGEQHPARARALGQRARAALALGQLDQAVADARAALAMVADYKDVRGEVGVVLALALAAKNPGDLAQARRVARQARADFAEVLPGQRAGVEELDAWLAKHDGQSP